MLEEGELLRQRREAEMRLVGLKKLARVRLEHHHAGKAAVLRHSPARGLEQCLMTAVHPVEIADRKRCTPDFVGNVIITVKDVHLG